MSKTTKLTAFQWTALYKLLSCHVDGVCTTARMSRVYRFVLNRTVMFNKLHERIKFIIFKNGSVTACIDGTGIDTSDLSKTFTMLTKANLVYTEKLNGRLHYGLNIIGVLNYILVKRLTYLTQSDKFKKHTRVIEDIKDKLSFYYESRSIDLRLPKGVNVKLKDVRTQVIKEKIKHVETVREKRKKMPLKIQWTKDYFKECCLEYTVGFSKAYWTQKDWGKVRNYMKECAANNCDPRDQIDMACKFWYKFQFKLHNKYGKLVHLQNSVNWEQFYLYRRQIVDFIAEIPSAKIIKIDNSSVKFYVTHDPTNERIQITEEDQIRIDNGLMTADEMAEEKINERKNL